MADITFLDGDFVVEYQAPDLYQPADILDVGLNAEQFDAGHDDLDPGIRPPPDKEELLVKTILLGAVAVIFTPYALYYIISD